MVAERPDFERLGDLLSPGGEAAGSLTPTSAGLHARSDVSGGADPNRRVAAVWQDAVGAEIAANARPAQLREGRLVVTTSSSAWAQTLQLMSELVIARLNERLGAGVVEKAVFRHAGWEEFPAEKPVSEPALSGSAGAGPTEATTRRRRSRTPPSTPPVAPPSTPPGVDVAALSDEERRALADLDTLPLTPTMKETIREAMLAGFVRARQDSGRSERTR